MGVAFGAGVTKRHKMNKYLRLVKRIGFSTAQVKRQTPDEAAMALNAAILHDAAINNEMGLGRQPRAALPAKKANKAGNEDYKRTMAALQKSAVSV